MPSRKSLVIGIVVLVMMALVALPAGAQGFVHGIEINVDGEAYYMAGVPVGDDGATDIPGHYWVNAGPNQVVGKHFNEGPREQFWSSDAPDGELLFMVHGIIDTWSLEKAEAYAEMGYVHRHELVNADGQLHPSKVLWLKHTARTSFTLDGGPHPPHDPPTITPGVAYNFMPNWSMPYVP
jgi:hypothetical protein